jgi:hypothetical protein
MQLDAARQNSHCTDKTNMAQVEGRKDGTSIILSLESKSSGQLEAARAALITDLPRGAILGEQRNSATL